MNFIKNFFQDSDGASSSIRLIFIVGCLTILLSWATVSFHKKELVDIPAGVQIALATLLAGKVGSSALENNNDKNKLLFASALTP